MKLPITLCAADTAAAAANTGLDWELVWSTVVTGFVVVFLILAILILFLSIMGGIFQGIDKSKSKKAAAKAASAAETAAAPKNEPSAPAAEAYYDSDDEEILAVISAAIAAYGEADGKQYRITSVTKRDKKQRTGGSAAGIAENTRSF